MRSHMLSCSTIHKYFTYIDAPEPGQQLRERRRLCDLLSQTNEMTSAADLQAEATSTRRAVTTVSTGCMAAAAWEG